MIAQRFKNAKNAQAAIAYLISQGWKIDLAKIQREIPGGLQDEDWIDIANGCLDWCMQEMAKEKVIPIFGFTRKGPV